MWPALIDEIAFDADVVHQVAADRRIRAASAHRATARGSLVAPRPTAVITAAIAVAIVAVADAAACAIVGLDDHWTAVSVVIVRGHCIRSAAGRRVVQSLSRAVVARRAGCGTRREMHLAKSGQWQRGDRGRGNEFGHESAVRSGKRSNSHDFSPERYRRRFICGPSPEHSFAASGT